MTKKFIGDTDIDDLIDFARLFGAQGVRLEGSDILYSTDSIDVELGHFYYRSTSSEILCEVLIYDWASSITDSKYFNQPIMPSINVYCLTPKEVALSAYDVFKKFIIAASNHLHEEKLKGLNV